MRIQDLVKGGPQLPRPKVADVAERSGVSETSYLLPRPKVADVVERSHMSETSYLRPGSRAGLRALEAFEFLVLNMHSPTF